MKHLFTLTLLAASLAASAQTAAHFDMSVVGGTTVKEEISGTPYTITSALPVVTVASPMGQALRFDGYSNYIRAAIPATLNAEALTVSVTLAAETYPMMSAEYETTPTYATVCGNLDEAARTGFALELSSQGDLRFRFGSASAKGSVFTIASDKRLACGRWSTVTAVLDKASNAARLYLNGQQVGTGKMGRAVWQPSTQPFFIGKDATEQKRQDKFLTNTFCGLIDDISIRNEVVAAAEIATPSEERPDFAYPAARYAQSLWRPQFHGMPTGGWTNECHGLTFSDGRWHVFFQKNANGPYMSRLHWGHISSANLYKWTEEPIALAPSEPYDMKGCWSGCIFDDNGKQRIIYTAVDNARAVMATATPADNSLTSWTKEGVIVNGKPQGLSDDFRDPYHFTVGGQEYLIVGSSKDGIGCCTLHKKTGSNWTNDGDIFFKGTNQAEHGTFWEMPNITPMDGGRWLFTCTPLNTNVGVRTLCFVGTIDGNGHFQAESMTPQTLEMNGISRDGYGLLSPSIYTKDGKTVLLGIVPDKISDTDNYRMGWAHNYSLPREISLDAQGHIVQKPYAALTNMRTQTAFASNAQLSGEQSLAPVSGRQIELLGDFTVGSGTFGFRFLKDGARSASLSYDTASGELTLDITGIDRTVQDNPYNGIYRVALPTRPAIGEKLRLHVFLDGSIADVFVADRWAFSVRLFPTNAAQTAAEAFATAATEADIQAWTLDAEQTTGTAINSLAAAPATSSFRLYDLQGRELAAAPAQGVYIRGGKKLVK